MKKNIIYTTLAVFTALFMWGCSLDETPKDLLPEDEAFRNPTLIYLNTVASIYTEIGADAGWGSGLAGTDRGLYDINVMTADEAITPIRGADWDDGGLWKGLFMHQWTQSTDMFGGIWDYLYRVVGKCNLNLDKLYELQEADPENIYFPEYIAEVRTVRAMYYYYLLDNFARVPIVTSSTTAISDVKQSERSEVFKFVVDELQAAAPLLRSAKSANTGEYYGRMTKSVAYFLLAKLALNAQVYSDDSWATHSAPTGSTNFTVDGENVGAWNAVIHYADLIKGEGYELNPNGFSANFSLKNEGSPENIFVIPMDPISYKAKNMYMVRTLHYSHAPAWNFEGWNGLSATKDLLAIFRKGGDDPRLEMSFFTGKVKGADGQLIVVDGQEFAYDPDRIAMDLSGSDEDKRAGARWAKYELDPNSLANGQLVHNDYVLFRYADVVLMKAEAKVRLGQNGDAELKEVRDRVGASNRAATLDNILDERMLELSWEGFRRQDLVRFGKYTQANQHRTTASGAFRVVFPIPEAVLNKNVNLTPNPGY